MARAITTAARSPFCRQEEDPFLLLESAQKAIEGILRRHAGRPLRRTWIEHPYGEEEICLLEEEEVLPAIERCMARVEEIDQALQREQELEIQRHQGEVAQRWPVRVATPWAAEPARAYREPPLRQFCSAAPSAPQQPSTGAVRWAHSRGRWQGRGGSGALMRVWES